MRVEVNEALCIGAGMCVAIAPEVFELTAENISVVTRSARNADNPDALRENIDPNTVADACDCCPVGAIEVAT